ncbi:MAG: class I SAM-dependent methyltransferase [Paracoccus sp. (in: a-proteobacteria)]
MIDPLSRLAILHGTDKFGYHDYTPHYHQVLGHLRDRPLRMLEIGVGGYGYEDRGGESLATWRDYLTQAQITGLDIQAKSMDFGPRVRIVQGSQVDADCLSALVAERGPFDVILDDGSHRNEHVVESYGLLFPTLKPGGIYLVEDVQTAFFPRFGGSLTLAEPNSVGMAIALMGRLVQGQGDDVVAAERFHNIFVLYKRDPEAPAPSVDQDRRVRAARAGDAPLSETGIDQIPDLDALSALIAKAFPGQDGQGTLSIRGPFTDLALLAEIFVQVEQNEIRVHHPATTLHEVARRIAAMAVYGDGVVLEIGDNDYPSNFAFNPAQPRAAAAIGAMGEVLEDPAASATGLMQYAAMKSRFDSPASAYPLIDRLAALGCKDERFFMLAGRRLRETENWPALEELCQEALRELPDNPHVLSLLSVALRRTGRQPEALHMLREVYERVPRHRAIVTLLFNLEIAEGHLDRAIALMEKSITLFPAANRPERLHKLIEICQISGDNVAMERAARRLLALLPDDPVAAEILGASGE